MCVCVGGVREAHLKLPGEFMAEVKFKPNTSGVTV